MRVRRRALHGQASHIQERGQAAPVGGIRSRRSPVHVLVTQGGASEARTGRPEGRGGAGLAAFPKGAGDRATRSCQGGTQAGTGRSAPHKRGGQDGTSARAGGGAGGEG